ncbi:hypothetical protein HN51_004457 [Arachis hypogaea]
MARSYVDFVCEWVLVKVAKIASLIIETDDSTFLFEMASNANNDEIILGLKLLVVVHSRRSLKIFQEIGVTKLGSMEFLLIEMPRK